MKRDYVCRLRILIDSLPPIIRESRFLFLIAKILFDLPNELFTFREDYNNGLIKDLSKFYREGSKHKIKRTAEGIIGLHLNKPIHLDRENVKESELKKGFQETVGNGNVFLYDHWGSVEENTILN